MATETWIAGGKCGLLNEPSPVEIEVRWTWHLTRTRVRVQNCWTAWKKKLSLYTHRRSIKILLYSRNRLYCFGNWWNSVGFGALQWIFVCLFVCIVKTGYILTSCHPTSHLSGRHALRVWKERGAYLGAKTNCSVCFLCGFSSVHPDDCWCSILYLATTSSFHILPHSQFTDRSIRR